MNYTPVETLESRVIIIAFMRAVSPVGGGRGRDADLRHAWQLALTQDDTPLPTRCKRTMRPIVK